MAPFIIDGKEVQIESRRQHTRASVGSHRVKAVRKDDSEYNELVKIRWREQKVVVEIPGSPSTPRTDERAQAPNAPEPQPLIRWIETGQDIGRVSAIDSSKDGSKLYVGYGNADKEAPVQVFQVSPTKLLSTIRIEPSWPGGSPHFTVVASEDGNFLYTGNYYGRCMTRIALQDEYAREDLDLVSDPRYQHVWSQGIGMTPDQGKVLVMLGGGGRSEEKNDQVAIVDVSNGNLTLLGNVLLRDGSTNVNPAFSPDSKFAYVITTRRESSAPTLYEICLARPYEVTRGLPIPEARFKSVVVSGRLSRIFVSDLNHRKIWVIDIETFKTVSEIPLGGHAPGRLALHDEAGLLVAACPESRSLFCIDAVDGTVLATVDKLRKQIIDVEISDDLDHVFVANSSPEGGVGVIDLNSLLTRVVFATDRDGGSHQIYSMTGRGQQVTRLTDNVYTERDPRWSPDGRRIAFVSNREGPRRICVMDKDGKSVAVLGDTDPSVSSAYGVPIDWSPDGNRITFIAADAKAIRSVNVASGEIQTLLSGSVGRDYGHHTALVWSVDGAIYFSSQQPNWFYNSDIFRLDPNTRNVTQVTDKWGNPNTHLAPATSSCGEEISAKTGDYYQIFTLPADGGEPTPLTSGDWDGGEPTPLTSGDWDDVDPDVCSLLRRTEGVPQIDPEAKPDNTSSADAVE